MARGRIADAARAGRILVSDGAWGTFLQARGLAAGECPESWCLARPAEVEAIARSYVEAGADLIGTNSFGGSRLKLARHALADRTAEINEAAARISRRAAGEERWVIGSAGPTGRMLVMEDVTVEELLEAFGEQAAALEAGGADAICVETMSDIGEAVAAVRAARERTRLEVICTFTFELNSRGEYRTMMGVSPAEAARAAAEAGASIVGANCGNGMERMVAVAREIRAAVPGFPILVQANAGLPVPLEGGGVLYPEGPGEMAAFVDALVEAGVGLVGGCCGTGPAHIAAIRAAVDRRTGRRAG